MAGRCSGWLERVESQPERFLRWDAEAA